MSYEPISMEGVILQCAEDSHAWFPELSQDLEFQTLALCGEAGELANVVKKIVRGTHKRNLMQPNLEEEAMGVFIYLCNIFHLLNIDPIERYNVERARNVKRFGNQSTP